MNLKAILKNWSPWHLRKRIAEAEFRHRRAYEIIETMQEKYNLLTDENKALKDQRAANYTGLMTECEKLKEENERLTSERVQILSFFKMNAVVQRHNAQKMLETCEHYQNDKGNTHEK